MVPAFMNLLLSTVLPFAGVGYLLRLWWVAGNDRD